MKRLAISLGLVAVLMLTGCQRGPSYTAEQARIDRESQVAGEPARTTEAESVAGSSAQIREQEIEQEATTGSRESSEYFGQSPQFGNAPETIVLKASNGNVTLSHKKHAEMMDCKTCHGDSPPGPIEGFAKEKAHSLCTGCHKEKGAGPTKCMECHKK